MIYAAWFALILMGFILGLLGAGGAILTVPILVYLFGKSSSEAIIYSFFIVGVLSVLAAIPGIIRRQFNFMAIVWFGIPSVIVLFIFRRFLLPLIPDQIILNSTFSLSKDSLLMLLFGIVVGWAGYSMLRTKPSTLIESEGISSKWRAMKIGIGLGILSGLLGVGGGFVIIPALVVLLGLEMKQAVNTSLVIISLNTMVGFASSFQNIASLDWVFLTKMNLIAIVGMVGGLVWRKSINQTYLKVIFAYTLLLVGVIILTKEFFSLL